MQPAIVASSLLRLPAFLIEHSIQPLEFLSRVGVQPNIFLQAGGWLPRDFCFRVAEEAVNLSGDQFVGAKVGASIKLSDLGEFGQHIVSAPTLGRALSVAEKQSFNLHRGSVYRIEVDADNAIFRFGFSGESKFNPHQYIIGTLAFLRNIALLANEPEGVSVCLAIPRFAGCSRLEETLGCKLEFGARDDAVIIRRELLDLPVRSTAICEVAPEDLPFPVVVARMSLDGIANGCGNLSDIASYFRCSERTVERHLAEYGITFADLKDQIRRDEAVRLIRDKSRTVTEIAMKLGYSDLANFNRAFRRWTGTAPSKFRNQLGY